MPCTEAYKEHIEYTFNAFCKIVIRHAAIDLSYTMQQSTHGVTGINGGKGKYPLNISQKKSFIHFVRQTHIS